MAWFDSPRSALFADKLIVEDRSPISTINVPPFLGGGTYGVLPPKLAFWTDLTILLASQMVLCGLFAIVVYRCIVCKQQGPAGPDVSSYIIGFGFVIPAALCIPFYLLAALDLQSMTLSMALICLPILVTFRCLEAMFGFTPHSAGKSMKNYVVYYSSMMATVYDNETGEPVKATLADILSRIQHFASLFVALSTMFSISLPFDFAPFATRLDAHSIDHGLMDIIHPAHLMNNFIAALLVSVSLSFSTLGASLLFNFSTGIMTRKVVHNPMFASKTPGEFWGRRWNNLVHSVLKTGIYKPTRRIIASPNVAVVATFLASGLIHEYVWAILFYVHEHQKDPATGVCSTCFEPKYGKNLFFFSWNGVVIALESVVGGWWLFQWMKHNLPGPVVTALVVMTALPFGHLFTGDWIAGGYFTHFQLGFPIVVKLR
mmetsp:Transcript_30361/g.66745  ORF Transcript_30361/g.66745 Transcript_30361/m.66745 type:complete len:430 (-) Transcript_30361:180-1469(-)